MFRKLLVFILVTLLTLTLFTVATKENDVPAKLDKPEMVPVVEPTVEVQPIVYHEIEIIYVEPVKVESIEVEEPKVTYSEEDLEMLACVIYQEVGSDACCDECRYRVADIVLNRVEDERFPNTLEEVLTQQSQYGRYHWTGVVWPERASDPNEAHAVERAYEVARNVLEGNHSEFYGEGYIWQAEFIQGADVVNCCNMYYGR